MGIAGIDVLNNIISIFKENLPSDIRIETIWKEKSVGLAEDGYDVIFVGLDSEDIDIYSLRHDHGYDWFHNVHFYFDLRTGKSEDRINFMVNEVMRIAKDKVIPNPLDTTKYIQLLPTGIIPLIEDYRNIYRYELTFNMMVFNP